MSYGRTAYRAVKDLVLFSVYVIVKLPGFIAMSVAHYIDEKRNG